MKSICKHISIMLTIALCVMCFTVTIPTSADARQSTIFGSYDVYLPASMIAEFSATTRKVVPSVSISARMEVQKNGVWSTYRTGVYPVFSGSNKTGWTTIGDYSSACERGYKYRLVVTYTSSGASVDYTSNERYY